MKDALTLMQEYKKRKEVKPPTPAQEFAPIFSQLLSALAEIANKEIPAPLIEVQQPEVKVELENPIEVIVPKQAEQKAPIVNIDNYDYTSLFIELKRSVDKLTKAVEERPGRWKAVRNNQGFIDYIDGVKKD